jgi:Leucine-rich repeat (LRR) protein
MTRKAMALAQLCLVVAAIGFDSPSGWPIQIVLQAGAAERARANPEQPAPKNRLEAVARLNRLGVLHIDSGEILHKPETEFSLHIRSLECHFYNGRALKESLPYLPELESLRVTFREGESFDAAEVLVQLKQLTWLKLRGPHFNAGEVANSEQREPDAKSMDVTEDQMKAIGSLQSLTSLGITNCRLTDREFAQLGGLRNLREMGVQRTCLTADCFRTVAKWPKIERFGVRYHILSAIDPETHRAIASLNGRLKSLSFGEWGETRVHPSVLAAVAEIQSLWYLDAGDVSRMQPADVEVLRKLKNLTHLEGSYVTQSPVGNVFRRMRR